jgi:hypothetical protein
LRKRLVFLVAASVLATACTEKLDSGSACPALCPVEQIAINDTTIVGVSLDTTVSRYPSLGAEAEIPLVTRVDGSLDVRAAIRFDILPTVYTSKAPDVVANTPDTIAFIDSTKFFFRVDTTIARLSDSITFAAYDIDTTGVEDTATSALASLYRDDRLLGTAKFSKATIGDTAALMMRLNDEKVLAKILAKSRLRVGLRVLDVKDLTVPLRATNGGGGPSLSFRPSRVPTGPTLEDSVNTLAIAPVSNTPEDDLEMAANLRDYTVVVKGDPMPPQTQIAVGGLPASRGYLRFDIPQRLLDSTQIVRATLRLTQLPSPTSLPNDSLTIGFWMGTASARVQDVAIAASIHESLIQTGSGTVLYGVANIRPRIFATADSATREIEVAGLLRAWFHVKETERPHALIIQSFSEGTRPLAVRFASREAAAALRPTLQITYVPRATAGVP